MIRLKGGSLKIKVPHPKMEIPGRGGKGVIFREGGGYIVGGGTLNFVGPQKFSGSILWGGKPLCDAKRPFFPIPISILLVGCDYGSPS